MPDAVRLSTGVGETISRSRAADRILGRRDAGPRGRRLQRLDLGRSWKPPICRLSAVRHSRSSLRSP